MDGKDHGVDIDRQRVKVGEEDQTLDLVLHADPPQDRAEQIAKVEIARGLDARDHAHVLLVAHASRALRFIRSFTSSSTKAPVKKHATA